MYTRYNPWGENGIAIFSKLPTARPPQDTNPSPATPNHTEARNTSPAPSAADQSSSGPNPAESSNEGKEPEDLEHAGAESSESTEETVLNSAPFSIQWNFSGRHRRSQQAGKSLNLLTKTIANLGSHILLKIDQGYPSQHIGAWMVDTGEQVSQISLKASTQQEYPMTNAV